MTAETAEQQQECMVAYERTDVEAELHELGLDQEELIYAVLEAHSARSQQNEWHPPTFGGMVQYYWGTSALREALIERRPEGRKWSKHDDNNFCYVTDPSGRTSIVVYSGSPETGDPDRSPTTKCPRGTKGLEAVAVNRQQLSIQFDESALVDAPDVATKPKVWFLLIYVNQDEVLCELSLPSAMDEERYVSEWQKRIILRLEWPEPAALDGEDIDIDVVARTG